jgi:hypothetical protein
LDLNPAGNEELCLAVADFIREESRKGRLVSQQEALDLILRMRQGRGEAGKSPASPASLLQEATEKNPDLQQLLDPEGSPHYYSSQIMTPAYSRILIGKKGSPLALMAEIVRENSAVYPRPVPVETFMEPPFEMTEEEIRTCLARIRGQEDLKDIAETTTSAGTLFLYSRLHLEPGHAALLAERLEMGPLLDP